MSNIANEQTKHLPASDELNKIGQGHNIIRKDGESDTDYAERMVYELDVAVEDLWACQDLIRELVKADE